ncbi:MAG: PTS sugar transporter subunit IIA [Atopobiaceae bacterium]|nr:PTS sugar transporter subunit IIA [Atopobiaceae bacterium]
MKYLLLVGHARLAEGIESALDMLLGSRTFVVSCGMEDGTSPDAFRAKLTKKIEAFTPEDEIVVLGDIAGGSPLKNALVALDDKGLGEHVMVFGGVNLAMAISALMAIEDGMDLEAIRDSILSDGTQAVKQI